MRLIGSEQTGFTILIPQPNGQVLATQLLQCESCLYWSDDVSWSDAFGGGICDNDRQRLGY